MRNLLILLFSILFLEGCFVVGVSVSRSWSNQSEIGPTITLQDTPKIGVNISRDNMMIPIPFFFIFFDRKDYGLSLYISSKEKFYKTIDSVTYIISDLKDIEISKGTCVKTSKEFRQMDADTSKWCYYQGWAETDYNIKIPRAKRKEDFKLDCTLFLHDINGAEIIKKRTFKLDLQKTGFGIAPFEI